MPMARVRPHARNGIGAEKGVRLGFLLTMTRIPCYDPPMARRIRCSDAGYVYHVLNRAVGRARLFAKPADYAAFEKALRQTWERSGMRLLSYLLMPNHWHLVVWPQRHGN